MAENLADSLRRWAGVYRGNGKPTEADLLEKAAGMVERAENDPDMAVHLAAFATVVEYHGQHGFAMTLSDASEAVRPRL